MRYIFLPYSVNSPAKLLSGFDAEGKLSLALEIRFCPEAPEAVFSYPVGEEILRFELDGKEFSPETGSEPLSRSFPEPYPRPKLTFSPELGWLNDPNGLFYLNGLWHMFFQHNPVGAVWGNMHWGHAVSENLVSWKEVGIALFPDDFGTMFSGSAIVDTENASGLGTAETPAVLLFYTAAGGDDARSRGKAFTQCLAYSTDEGRTFKKYAGNPIIPPLCRHSRDPKVVRDGHGGYYLALYLDDPERSYLLFASRDLLHWEKIQTLKLSKDSECPDFYPLELDAATKWVFSGASDFYAVGDMENGAFRFDSIRRLQSSDTGYAAQTWSDAPGGRRIKIWWNRWIGIPEKGPRRCSMSAPCDVSLVRIDGAPRLSAEICPEIFSAFPQKSEYGPLSGKTEIPCSPTCAVKLRTEDPSSPFSLLLNGVSVDFDGRFLSVSGRKYETDVPPEEVTVFFDGLNFQLHACRGTLCVISAAVPETSGLVLNLPENSRARLTLFRF